MFSALSGHRKIVIGIVAAIALASILVFVFVYLQSSGKKEYKANMIRNWNLIEEKAEGFTDALNSVKTVDDFKNLNSAAVDMRDSIEKFYEKENSKTAPYGMGDLKEKEMAVLGAMGNYLELVIEMADNAKVKSFNEERQLIESRARKAVGELNEFLEMADFLTITITADFFNAPGKIGDAITYRGDNADEQNQEILGALNSFMNADIKEINPDLLWDMASSNRKAAIQVFGGSKETMGAYRTAQWGSMVPTDYFIDQNSINITSPGVAMISVIVYVKDGSPMNAQVELVREPDGWKLDVYPFLGWVSE
ncbi:MAG: hypothetical protein JW738_10045 [Actinobacteria bacterium]|nr:hypothetical protein [Actinomycetota bacterium]